MSGDDEIIIIKSIIALTALYNRCAYKKNEIKYYPPFPPKIDDAFSYYLIFFSVNFYVILFLELIKY